MDTPPPEHGDRPEAERQGRSWLTIALPVLWLLLGLAGGLVIIMVVDGDDAPPPADVTTEGPTARPTGDPDDAPESEEPESDAMEPAETEPTPEPTTEPTPSRAIGVSVYNQIGIGGLAARVAGEARAAGWQIGAVADWRGAVPQDTIYFPPGQRAEAELLGGDIGIARIMPSVENMSTTHLTVVLASPR